MEVDALAAHPAGAMFTDGAMELGSTQKCNNTSDLKHSLFQNDGGSEAIVESSPGFDIPKKLLSNPIEVDPPLYSITASQFNELQDSYAKRPLPNDILFPWLHGVDGQSHRQNLFFGVRHCHAPKHRGLMLLHADEKKPHCKRLAQSVLPSDILTQDDELISLNQDEQEINLRNFRIQVCRYASISDIVVYGNNAKTIAIRVGIAQAKLKIARLNRLAQIKRSAGPRAVKDATPLDYCVFVVTDPYNVIEQSYPHLVSYNAVGEPVHCIDFWTQEREEMRAMSCACEVTDNVWFGNTRDAPVVLSNDEDIAADIEPWNPQSFSICIEAHEFADMPTPTTLEKASEALDTESAEIIHLDMVATGTQMSSGEFVELFTRLLSLLEFIDAQASDGRRILVHCADGYTETSLLALSWLMYKLNVSLPEAYLYLQERRSFFVSEDDVSTLQRIRYSLIRTRSTHPADHKRKRAITQEGISELNNQNPNKGSLQHKNDDSAPRKQRVLYDDSYINAVSNFHENALSEAPSVPLQIEPMPINDIFDEAMAIRPLVPPSDIAGTERFPWFYVSQFDGSFPSRILPFVYLGNLGHATNPGMLKALGITHIISVGENPGLSPTEFRLLQLDNLYDDGIDSVRTRYDETIRFIDEAYRAGTRCLIHCRVGVSRSAAVTICYIMHHLGLDLVQAYLFVRARRLNVIIQPNLKFMYELMQLEQHLLGKSHVFWPIMCREIHMLNESCRDE